MTSDSIEQRVRQLLALARNNPEPAEAALAFARAQEIATRHGLELDEIAGAGDEESAPPPREVESITDEIVDVQQGKLVGWRVTIGSAFARANGCKPYIVQRTGVRAVGQPSDLATARYLAGAVIREVDAMAVEAIKRCPPGETPRTYGAAWRRGCADAISMRLQSQRATVDAERKAIDERRALALQAATEAEQRAELASATMALVRVERASDYLTRRHAAITAKLETESFYKFLRDGSRARGRGFSGGSGSRSGYASGRAHGSSMNLGGGSRRAIGGGK